jgi:hypothetical protein
MDHMRLYFLAAAGVTITVFWDVAPYSLVEVQRRFRGAFSLPQLHDVEPVSASETSVGLYETTQYSILEDNPDRTVHFDMYTTTTSFLTLRNFSLSSWMLSNR